MNDPGAHSPTRDPSSRDRSSDRRRGLVREKIDQATESTEAKFLARIAAPTVLAGLLTFFGLQLWNGQKEQGDTLLMITQQLGDQTGRLNLHEWRLNRLERDQVPASKEIKP